MASSSSKRMTRRQSLINRNNTCKTLIDPKKDIIDICPVFKSFWANELYNDPIATLRHPTGKNAILELEEKNGNTYFVNGKSVALLYGIREPTEVNLHYKAEDQSFTLSFVKEVRVIEISSGSEDEEVYIFDTEEYNLWQHDNDRVFGWEVKVSEAYANKDQVLHIPARCAKYVLRGRKIIFIRSLDNMDHIKCTLKLYRRKVGKKWRKEMYITEGWYEFNKANDLKFGDLLKCQLSDPPKVLVIEIVRGGAQNQ